MIELQVGGNSLSFLKTKLELKQQIRDGVIPFNNGEDRFLVNMPHEMEATEEWSFKNFRNWQNI